MFGHERLKLGLDAGWRRILLCSSSSRRMASSSRWYELDARTLSVIRHKLNANSGIAPTAKWPPKPAERRSMRSSMLPGDAHVSVLRLA